MKLLSIIFTLIISTLSAQTFEWVHVNSVTITTNPLYLKNNVSVDVNGNPVYSVLTKSKLIHNHSYYGDVNLIKRNSNGEILWSKEISGKVFITRIIIDNENNIICIGSFKDTLFIDHSFALYSSNISSEEFIFKLNSNGNTIWLKNLSPHLNNLAIATSGAVDGNGNIFITNDNWNTSSILKFDSQGNYLSTIPQTNVKAARDISVDVNGNIWVSGTTDMMTVQSFNGLDTLPPANYNEYVVKYLSDGSPQWVKFVEDITFQESNIVTDNSGNVYWSGRLLVPTWFGNLFANGPQWTFSYYLTKIDADGNFIWLRELPHDANTFGDATIGSASFLWYDGFDGIFISGYMRNSLNFGNGIVLNSNGGNDILLMKYSTDGDILWCINAGSSSFDEGTSVSSDKNGNVYLTGRVGPNSIFGNINLVGGNLNTFITKIVDSTVPVELQSFTGFYTGNGIELQWITASEKNNFGFEIERKELSASTFNDWQNIGFVNGNGTTTEINNYSFLDNKIKNGKYAYRLKQIDFDGTFEYSKEIEVEVDFTPEDFALYQNYPNPFNPITTIKFSIPIDSHVILEIFNVLGEKTALLIDKEMTSGNHSIEFDAGFLNSGIYLYRLTSNNFTSIKKFILMK